MPRLQDAAPQISVKLYKTITRTTINGRDAVSSRYQGKDDAIDLTPLLGDGSHVRTSKNVREPSGTFSITFADKPYNSKGEASSTLESIYGLVEPMDVVEIRMWRGIGPKPDPLPIKMRGFVTDVSRGQTMSPGGEPIRHVVVSGHDYGKIWQFYQVLYLRAYAAGIPLLSSFAMYELFGDEVKNADTASGFVTSIINNVINPHMAGFMPPAAPVKQLTVGEHVSVAQGMVNLSHQNMEGAIYDVLTRHLDVGHWQELYTEDYEDATHVVFRSIPAIKLRTSTGDGYEKIIPDAPDPVFVDIQDIEVQSYSVARTDLTVANFFWVNNVKFDVVSEIYRKLSALPPNDRTVSIYDYPNAAEKYYGTRAMFGQTNLGYEGLINMLSGLKEPNSVEREVKMVDWITKRRIELLELNKDNAVFERGSVRVKGGPMRGSGEHMKAGDYAVLQFGNIIHEAYVVQIDDEFVPYQGYHTTLTFERSNGFAVRTSMGSGKQAPWLAEQVKYIGG